MFDLLKKLIIILLPILLVTFLFIALYNIVYDSDTTFSIEVLLSRLSNIEFITKFDFFSEVASIDFSQYSEGLGNNILAILIAFGLVLRDILRILIIPVTLLIDLFQVVGAFIIY